jgi:3-hydroxymyristoyl/3-hydroxydecanoyl-(acyl carrier protein) dehydratase
MVNPDIQGKRYPRTRPYVVGLEKLREFSAATFGETSEGFVVPPTFPIAIQEHSLSLVISDSEAALDFSRVVHGEQRFVYQRQILPGDELTSELEVASVKSLGGNHMITFNTEIFDKQDKLVCTAISTLVVRGEDA